MHKTVGTQGFSVFEDATRRDSIYPSDLDNNEDMQTQTVFEPFKTAETFALSKANKGSPQRRGIAIP